jgi:hypothetical protein
MAATVGVFPRPPNAIFPTEITKGDGCRSVENPADGKTTAERKTTSEVVFSAEGTKTTSEVVFPAAVVFP